MCRGYSAVSVSHPDQRPYTFTIKMAKPVVGLLIGTDMNASVATGGGRSMGTIPFRKTSPWKIQTYYCLCVHFVQLVHLIPKNISPQLSPLQYLSWLRACMNIFTIYHVFFLSHFRTLGNPILLVAAPCCHLYICLLIIFESHNFLSDQLIYYP